MSGSYYDNIVKFDGGDTLNITLENDFILNYTDNYTDVTFGTTTSPLKIFDTNGKDVTSSIKNVNIDLQSCDVIDFPSVGTKYQYTDLRFGGSATSSGTKAGSGSWTVEEGGTFIVTNTTATNGTYSGESILHFGGDNWGESFNEPPNGIGGDGSFTVNGGKVSFEDDTMLQLGGYSKVGGNGTFTITGGEVTFDLGFILGGQGEFDQNNSADHYHNYGVGMLNMSGGTLQTYFIEADNKNSAINLTGGNLILDDGGSTGARIYIGGKINIGANAKFTFRGGSSWITANQINIARGSTVAFEGDDFSISADQINIAQGSTFTFDISKLSAYVSSTGPTDPNYNDPDPSVGLFADRTGELGKFNIELLNVTDSTTGLYYLVYANDAINLTDKVNDAKVNDRLGLSAKTDVTADKVKVTITYDSNKVDSDNRVATWTSTDTNATWGVDEWSLSGGSKSSAFNNDDQVEFKNGNTNDARNITVGSAGVTVAPLATSNPGTPAMLVESKADYTFEGGKITASSGDIKKAETGTLTIKNEVELNSGNLDLTAGTTVIDGKVTLSGQNGNEVVKVGKGATLAGGNGSTAVIVGNVVFNNGSLHSPGHSPGTFAIDGKLSYDAGSMIYIDFGKTAATTDLITATGDIIFAGDNDGKVRVVVGNSGDLYATEQNATEQTVFEAGSGKEIKLDSTALDNKDTTATDNKITIADSTGKKSIEFEGANGIDLEKATVSDTSTKLKLTARGTLIPVSDLTPNQSALYDSIKDSKPAPPNFANQLQAYILSSSLTEAERKAALEAALPTVNSALFVATQRNVVAANRSISNRLQFLQNRQSRSVGRYLPQQVMLGQSCDPCSPVSCEPCEPCDSCEPCDPCDSFGGLRAGSITDAWFEGFGDFLRQSNTGSLQGYRVNAGGFNLGIDRQIARRTIFGVGFGGAYADLKTNDHSQWGDVEQYIFSVYGSRSWDELTLSLSGGYAYSDYKLTRNPGGTKITSKHDGDLYFASFELAQKRQYRRYDLTPFYALDFIRSEEGAYKERDATKTIVANIDSQNSNSYLQTIGLRLGRTTKWYGWIVKPVATAGWVHDYGDGNVYTTAQYVGGNKFTIKGAQIHKNRGLVGINLNVAASPNLTLYGGYNGEFANQFQIQTAQIGLNYAF